MRIRFGLYFPGFRDSELFPNSPPVAGARLSDSGGSPRPRRGVTGPGASCVARRGGAPLPFIRYYTPADFAE